MKKPTKLQYQRLPLWLRKFLKWFVLPALLYLALFFISQPQYFGNFSNGYFLDNGDGFQNVWNIWWVDKSIVQDGASPYFTNMLHWPIGTTLLPQTMNIFNCLMAIPLIHVFGFSLVEATNFAVLFAFATGGVTMLWFIQKLYGKYWLSLLAGGLFTFSTYHMAHAQGHLQLVTFQFIPLFLLAFWTLLEKPKYRYALLAAGALFLVVLSDYYYLFWSVLLGGFWTAWQLWRRELKLNQHTLKVLGTFAMLSGLLVGPFMIGLSELNKHDPLSGFHDPRAFSLDPVSIFVPGGSWRWRSLTEWHWSQLSFWSETSVYFGWGLIAAVLVAFYVKFIRKEKPKIKLPDWLPFWWIVGLFFGILALGPRLRLYGNTLDRLPLPYVFMERLFPTLKLSGMPVRWVLISLIAAIIIACAVLAKLNLNTRKGRVLLALFLLVSVIDLWATPLPLTNPQKHSQPYVEALKRLPPGAVIDNGAENEGEQLFHQTIHGKPIVFGYVTRLPKSVADKDIYIWAALESGRYDELCHLHKVRYVTLPIDRPLKTAYYPIVYSDNYTLIYDLKNSDNC